MKELLRKIENLWIAIAFAEAGEHETSQDYHIPDLRDEAEPQTCQVL